MKHNKLSRRDFLRTTAAASAGVAFAGTARASINNMVKGVSEGFVKKMQLVGVGYRAQVSGNKLTLSLGYSNPVEYSVPEGITVEAPSQTELHVKGSDKQKVGQVASEIRSFRPPEPYKIKYSEYKSWRKDTFGWLNPTNAYHAAFQYGLSSEFSGKILVLFAIVHS